MTSTRMQMRVLRVRDACGKKYHGHAKAEHLAAGHDWLKPYSWSIWRGTPFIIVETLRGNQWIRPRMESLIRLSFLCAFFSRIIRMVSVQVALPWEDSSDELG